MSSSWPAPQRELLRLPDVGGHATRTCNRECLANKDHHVLRAQVMMKLKNSRNLDARQSLLLESAFYAARPPERTAARRKQRPPLHEYMRHLVHQPLTQADLKQARSFKDAEIVLHLA